MTNQPNIFEFATKELSQDAAITWLLTWAKPEFKIADKKMHQLGCDFLQSLLEKQNITLTKFENLEIKQQFYKIDVFACFNMEGKSYGIIIEDKIHATEGENQLANYKKKIEGLNLVDIIVPIYLKTGYQIKFDNIIENKYYHYSIKDLLKVVTIGKVQAIDNDVLTSFYNMLLEREEYYDNAHNDALSFVTKPIKNWNWWSCAMFFHNYKKHFDAGWGEVANNREALLAFWFGGKNLASIDKKIGIYMDLVYKHNRLRVNYRIYLKEKTQINKDTRNHIYDGILPFLKNHGIETRKARFSKAKKSMLLAEITNLDRNLSYIEFVKKIELYQNALNEYVDSRNAVLI